MIRKKIVGILITIILTAFVMPVNGVFASEPMFSIYPASGVVRSHDKGFTLDLLLDSGGEDVSTARFVITFDPKVIQIKKASRNESLFDQWPDDESSLDNQEGVVMLTGFTQSGSSDLYRTDGNPDVMARLEFEIVSEDLDNVVIDFEYDGSDSLFKSCILKDGSPPQNILNSKPKSVELSVSSTELVNTGLELSHIGIVFGLILIAVGVFITSTKNDVLRKRRGTVVIYE